VKILLVDDDLPTLKVVGALLRAEGHEVDACSDGATAVERLGAATYGALLADLVMPRMGGDELVRRARALDPALRCVIISGQASPSGGAPDGAAWLSKPLDFDALLALLDGAGPTR
jgi:CheY-like chemotaxis protein